MRSISRRRPSTSTARKTTVAVGLGGLDQLLDLGFGQVFPLAISRIRLPARRNCSLFDSWHDQRETRFRLHLSIPSADDCLHNAPKASSQHEHHIKRNSA